MAGLVGDVFLSTLVTKNPMAEKKPKITICPDGVIHVNDKAFVFVACFIYLQFFSD